MERWLEPLYDAEAMRAVDSWAIERAGVPSLELMETAGRALAEATERHAADGPVRVVCGKGNNGGDGLVAARHLADAGHHVEVLLLWPAAELSVDSTANLERFHGEVRELAAGEAAAALVGSGVVVDAIFGTGFSGAPRDPAAAAIAAINDCGAPVVAADIASGVDASTGEVEGAAVERRPSRSAFTPPSSGTGSRRASATPAELEVAPIGIPDGAPDRAQRRPDPHVACSSLLRRRGPDSTKFTSGEVLVVGGSRGLTGAVCMASIAAARSGAGYATVAVPAELEPIFEVKLTEVMSVGCPSADGAFASAAAEPIAAAAERAAAVVLGPGIGARRRSPSWSPTLLGGSRRRLSLDADGLNALAGRLELIAARRAPTVLTPHAGELAGCSEIDSGEVNAHRLELRSRSSDAGRRDRRPQGRRHDRRRARRARRSSTASPARRWRRPAPATSSAA